MRNNNIFFIIFIFLLIVTNLHSQDFELNNYKWQLTDTKSEPTKRHECAFVKYNSKFYLLGGRGINPVDVYDPNTNTWNSLNKTPYEIHHFQPVVYKNAIYIVCAMTGKYPKEMPLKNILIYYPDEDRWEEGDNIPVDIRRGAAGAVLYKNKIYIVCGIDFGHTSGTNNLFNSYDLETGQWETLVKAPHIRDHFSAILVKNKLYCIGGRNSSVHFESNFTAFFNATVPYVDVYDFTSAKWITLKSKLPTPTAAGSIVNIGDFILYIGGEGKLNKAYDTVQCLNLNDNSWNLLNPLNIGRHGTSAIWFNNKVFIVAGSPNKGGGNISSMEIFSR